MKTLVVMLTCLTILCAVEYLILMRMVTLLLALP